jgi:membrane-associated phospholipid phosphatase
MTAGLLGLAAIFLVLIWQVQTGGALVLLDGMVNAGLAPWRTRAPLAAFAWLTQVGTGAAGAAIALTASGLLWSGGRLALVGPLWLTFIGAQVTTWSLKFVTARVRPPFLEGVTAGSPSFPSAHATVSVAIYGFLALAIAQGLPEQARAWVFGAAGLLIALICFSRLFLSLHYLTDVLAGGVVAAAWLVLGWRLARGWGPG